MITHLKFKIEQDVLVSTKQIQDKRESLNIDKIEGKNDDYIGVDLEGKVYFQIDKKSEKRGFEVFVKPMPLKPVELDLYDSFGLGNFYLLIHLKLK
ncbi:MAG: hypothetical protein KBC84_10700 [Proteobacteria bacterium]|nr:hypothetical protein [Pseudomonadota bacterium]